MIWYIISKVNAKKRFDNFDNGIKFFNQIKSDDMKLEVAEKTKKICLNQI